jgi:hypothetical protein
VTHEGRRYSGRAAWFDANARAGDDADLPREPDSYGDAAMMGMIAAAAVLLGFAVLTFWTDVESWRARRRAYQFDRTVVRNRADARRR